MSYSADHIIFDGKSSEQFGLMLAAKLDNNEQEDASTGTKLTIVEDSIARRHARIHYGSKSEEPLSFKLVLSVMDPSSYLDRYDQALIAGWLYGHQNYKYLSIGQPDMSAFRYKCKVTELAPISVASHVAGFVVSVRCDAPYAYLLPTFDYINCTGSAMYHYRNRSNLNDYYRPVIHIEAGAANLSIANQSDYGRPLSFEGISPGSSITVDCQNEVISSSDGKNLYEHCSLQFPRFLRGDNLLRISGACSIKIDNEFPMLIGT